MKNEEETFGAKSEKKKLANGDGSGEQVDAEADPEEVEQLHSVEFIKNWNVIKMVFKTITSSEWKKSEAPKFYFRYNKGLDNLNDICQICLNICSYLAKWKSDCEICITQFSFFDWNLPCLNKYMHMCTHFAQYCQNLTSGTDIFIV